MDMIAAVQANNLEHVRLLLEQGAEKDNGDSYGQTPLYWACRGGHLNVAQYLVEHGAALDKANNSGWTPLMTATIHGHLELARYLLVQGTDRDKAANDGFTPLHCAAFCQLEVAMLLMRHGADLNARNNGGQLPIDMGHHNTEEIKQATCDEPRRRMDEAPGKRATEQDHPNAATSASAQQEEEEGEEAEEQSNKRQRLNDEGAVAVVESGDQGL